MATRQSPELADLEDGRDGWLKSRAGSPALEGEHFPQEQQKPRPSPQEGEGERQRERERRDAAQARPAHPCHIGNSQGVPEFCANDPSAGSPTETLLRLLLPLSDKVYITSFIAKDNSVQNVYRITQNR